MYKAALTVVIALSATVALAELAMRAGAIRFSTSFHMLDLERGWVLRPGAEGWQSNEGEAAVRINSRGMRDRERSVEKPAGSFRVAVAGDSFTEAMQVPLEKTFPALMEQELSGCAALGGRKVEVLNFGVGAYGTAQQLLTLRNHALRFRPDLVINVFYAGNDFYNNHRQLNPSNGDAAPYFVLDGERLALEQPFSKGGKPGAFAAGLRDFYAAAVRYSRLLQTATQAYYNVQRQRTRAADQNRLAAEFGPDYMEWLAYRPPSHPAMRESWRVTERLLLQMRAEVESSGARFRLVLASNAIQVHPDRSFREAYRRKYAIDDLLYADRRIRQAAESAGIEVSEIAGPMREYAERTGTFFHGFRQNPGAGHWNEAGHQFVARLLSGAVCEEATRPDRRR